MTASASGANSPHDQWIYISTPSVNPVNFTVKKPDGTTFFSGQVSNTDSQEFSAGPNGFNGNLFVRDFETVKFSQKVEIDFFEYFVSYK